MSSSRNGHRQLMHKELTAKNGSVRLMTLEKFLKSDVSIPIAEAHSPSPYRRSREKASCGIHSHSRNPPDSGPSANHFASPLEYRSCGARSFAPLTLIKTRGFSNVTCVPSSSIIVWAATDPMFRKVVCGLIHGQVCFRGETQGRQ